MGHVARLYYLEVADHFVILKRYSDVNRRGCLSSVSQSSDRCLKMSQVGSYCVCLLSESGPRAARDYSTHALKDRSLLSNHVQQVRDEFICSHTRFHLCGSLSL